MNPVDLSDTWHFLTLCVSWGIGLAFVFHFLGVLSGVGLRWIEEGIAGD